MSDNYTFSALGQEVVSEFPIRLIDSYIILSSSCMLFYDYLLTLPLELATIWDDRFNLSKCLFILNRYPTILYQLMYLFLNLYTPDTDIGCRFFFYTFMILDVLSVVGVNGIFIMRTYAIYGRNWVVLFALLIPAICNVASHLWLFTGQPMTALPQQLQIGPNTCATVKLPTTIADVLFDVISNAVFDAMVLVLTVYRIARQAVRSKQTRNGRNLSYTVLRDGFLYYVAIFLPTYSILVLDSIAINSENSILSPTISSLGSLANAIQTVMVNRLALNLRYITHIEQDTVFSTRIGLDPPTFAENPFFGDAGALVRATSGDRDEDTGYKLEEITRTATVDSGTARDSGKDMQSVGRHKKEDTDKSGLSAHFKKNILVEVPETEKEDISYVHTVIEEVRT